jgi:glucosylceramidase
MSIFKPLLGKNRGKVFFLSALMVTAMLAPANAVLKAKWRYSTASNLWVAEQQLSIVNHTTQATEIVLDTTVKYQTMNGWGGSPNESGVIGLHKLPQALQDSVIKMLFDTVTGCKFNMIRLPIGCSDFSIDGYSLNDNANDYTMSKINIHRDSLVTLAFVMAALKVNPNLKVWGSPWTAPAWMKGNTDWSGGGGPPSTACELKQDTTILRAYALYFSKAVTLYKNYGIPFFALSFQNEPYCCQSFPSMIWPSGAKMLNFMKNYLGPRMKADHPTVELWTPTMNLNDTNFFVPMLRDPYTSTIITTVCYQYQGEDVINALHKKFPNLTEYATELACGGADNVWNYPQSQTFPEIKKCVSNGASGAFQWNLLLCSVPGAQTNQLCGYSGMWKGSNGALGNWPQQAMITIDTAGKKIAYNTQYYGLKHLSYYIRPGSKVVRVIGQYDTNEISVKNPDGSLVVVTNNQNNAAQAVAICLGTQMIQASLPPLSFASFKIYDSTGTSVSGAPGKLAMPYIAATGSFKVTGDRFTLSQAYEGTTNICKVYDLHGRLVREFAVQTRTINLSKDLGVSQGTYIVHVKAVAHQPLAAK